MNYPFIPILSAPSGGGASPTVTKTVAVNVVGGDLVYVNSLGQIDLSVSTTSLNDWNVAGVVQSAALAGNPTETFVLYGLEVPVRFVVPPPLVSNGVLVFLNNVPGTATLNPPTSTGNTIFKVGILTGADGVTTTPNVLFQPQFIAQVS